MIRKEDIIPFVFLDMSVFFCRCSRHKILDLSFYDEDTLSFLLQEDTQDTAPVLVQLKLTSLEDHTYTAVSTTLGQLNMSSLTGHPDM